MLWGIHATLPDQIGFTASCSKGELSYRSPLSLHDIDVSTWKPKTVFSSTSFLPLDPAFPALLLSVSFCCCHSHSSHYARSLGIYHNSAYWQRKVLSTVHLTTKAFMPSVTQRLIFLPVPTTIFPTLSKHMANKGLETFASRRHSPFFRALNPGHGMRGGKVGVLLTMATRVRKHFC